MECWICLAGEENNALSSFNSYCNCSSSVRPVHARCLGRWQLQRAGTREETHCRFCNSKYQLSWRESLSGPSSTDSSEQRAPEQQPNQRRPPTPIMAIIFEGQVHRIKVYPGSEGKARFQQQIRDLVKLGDDEEFEVEFECKAPDSGTVLHLDGMDAFDAATHCAALTAAERQTWLPPQRPDNVSPQQQEAQEAQGGRRQHGATADVQLQVAAQHSTPGSCPGSSPLQAPAVSRSAAAGSK